MKILEWLRENMLVAFGMMAVAAVLAGAHQASETDARNYKLLAAQWPNVSAPVKSEIAEAMKDGSVSRWEFTKLVRDIMDDRRFLAFEMTADTVEQERARLRKEVADGSK